MIIGELREVLDQLSNNDRGVLQILGMEKSKTPVAGGAVRFDPISSSKISKLNALGLIRPGDRQNNGPRADELMSLEREIENMLLIGYYILSYRIDTRITFDGFILKKTTHDQERTFREHFKYANSIDFEGNDLEFWWD